MNYIKHTDFGSRCQSKPPLNQAFAKLLEYYDNHSPDRRLVIHRPDVRPFEKIRSFLDNQVGCRHLWQAGAWVLSSDERIDLSKINDLPRNGQISILTDRLLVQASFPKESETVEVDYNYLANVENVEVISTHRPSGRRIDLRVEFHDGETMTLRNVPIGIHEKIVTCIKFFGGCNKHL